MRRQTGKKEYFKIKKHARRYDRRTGKFIINIAYETAAPKPTQRVVAVAEGFGLGLDQWEKFVIYDNVSLTIGPKDIIYITGDSGSGKSILLRALEKDIRHGVKANSINIAKIKPDHGKPLIETVGKTVNEGLELLSKVGLNDAFLFLRSYNQLSDGQKYRYKIAKLIESKTQFWILDEFAATLDRDTAKIIAYNLQKLARQQGKAVIAATTHTDLFEDLNPSVHIHKRFGKEIKTSYHENTPVKECSLAKEMHIEEGSNTDWKQLAPFHYRSHRTSPPRKIFNLKRKEELCGVIVYCYPPPISSGRRLVLPKMPMQQLNNCLNVISRVVVHPKYRTIGLGCKLVKETLPLSGTPYVEMLAVMAKYNPFAEKAGMKKLTEQPASKEVSQIAAVLQKIGFNTELLGSKNYVLKKLEEMNPSDLKKIRQAFIRFSHVRFKKTFSDSLPFGRRSQYIQKIQTADFATLANLIKICGLLLQTKAYLFWSQTKQKH